jgi:hypothetical protein
MDPIVRAPRTRTFGAKSGFSLRMRAAIAATLVALSILAAAPGAGAVTWSAPEVVATGDDVTGAEVQLVGNPSGFLAVGMTRANRVVVATARGGGGFGGARRVPGSGELGEFGYSLDLDEHGNLLVVWDYDDNTRGAIEEDRFDEGCCTGARFTVLRRDGSFDPVTTLAPRGRNVSVQAARIERGRVGIAYRESPDIGGSAREGLLVLTQPSHARKRRVDTVEGAGPASRVLALAFVRGLPRLVLRRAYDDPSLVESAASSRYEFRETGVLARDVDPAEGPRIATAPGGHQAIAYTLETAPDVERVFAGTRAPGRRFRIRPAGPPGEVPVGTPAVAVARNGSAIVSWTGPGYPPTLFGATSLGGGPFSAPRTVAPKARNTSPDPQVDVNSRGTGVVAWERGDATIQVGFVTRARRVRDVAQVASPRRRGPYSDDAPDVAVDDRGRAVVVYVSGDQVLARRAIAPPG